MIYIVTQQVFNGTVTMGIWTKGVEANTFLEAKDKVMSKFSKKVKIHQNDDETLFFSVPQGPDAGYFTVEGRIDNRELEII